MLDTQTTLPTEMRDFKRHAGWQKIETLCLSRQMRIFLFRTILLTFSHFYLRLGWNVFGQIDCYHIR